MSTYRFNWLLFGFVIFILTACKTPSVPVDSGVTPTGGQGSTELDSGTDATDATNEPCEMVEYTAKGGRAMPREKSPRVIGGHPTTAGTRPYVVALATQSGFQYCGATLIRSRWLLTAAHCKVAPGEFGVLGRVDLTQPGGEIIPAALTLISSKYSDAGQGYDFSLVRLSRPSTQTPIEMVSEGWEGPGVLASVAGWGLTTEYAQVTSTILLETEVPIYAAESCTAAYGFISTVICAGYPEGGRDTCQGDSGGGLFVQQNGWKQAGITSFGDGCGKPGRPGAYTAIGKIRRTIDACLRRYGE